MSRLLRGRFWIWACGVTIFAQPAVARLQENTAGWLDERVAFDQVAGTQMACTDSTATEVPFRDALKNASRLTITGDRLELFNAGGTRLALFVAGSPPRHGD